MAAPENPDRYRDLAEQVLVFGGVGVTQLALLAVVRRLALGAEPGGEQIVKDTGTKPQMRGVVHVAGHQRPMGVAGKRLKDAGVLEHERKQSTLPIAAGHRVGQQQIAKGGALEQERAQSDGAADVGRDDAWGVKSPMVEQSGDAAALRGKAES